MRGKVKQVPVRLDAGDIPQLCKHEIRLILRGTDEFILCGGRGLLVKAK